jgi:glutamine synthetase
MTDGSEVVTACADGDLEFVRLFFVDTSGVIRGRAVSADRIESALEGSVTCPRNVLSMDFTDGYAADGAYGPDGEFRLDPDPETFVALPYAEQAGLLLCDLATPEGGALPACGRSALQSFLAAADYDVVSAFESECYLFRSREGGTERLERTPLFSADGIHRAEAFATELKRALGAQDIHLDTYYPEGGAGQIEVVTRHAAGITAADDHVVKRRTVKRVAAETGHEASFAPMVAPDSSPAGMHLNVSLWDDGENVFHDDDTGDRYPLSDRARHFVGGLMEHAPGLCALTAPTELSYRRMQLHDLAADRATWGNGDRRCLVRVPLADADEGSTRIEYRLADNTVNPYLALLGVLAAGGDGVRKRMDPGAPAGEGGKATADRLPATLSAALDAFEDDAVLRGALGEELAETYAVVKRSHVSGRTGTLSQDRIDDYRRAF